MKAAVFMGKENVQVLNVPKLPQTVKHLASGGMESNLIVAVKTKVSLHIHV